MKNLDYFFIMDSYLLKINKLISEKKLDKETLSVKINVKRATFYNYLNGSTKMPVEILKKLSNVLEVPISYFFDEGEKTAPGTVQVANGNNNRQTISYKNEKIEELQKQIENLEKLLQAKDEIINLLKNK